MSRRSGALNGAAFQRGAATIEFYIIAFLVMVPLLMGILQLALFMMAKNTVNVATLGAARAGAASGMNKSEMRNAFAVGIAPLYVAKGMEAANGSNFVDVSANYAVVGGVALAQAQKDMLIPVINSITIINPTAAAFDDFGIVRPSDKARVIPVENLLTNNANGGKSKQQRSDALLLKIQARYCYRMVIPIIDTMILTVLKSDLFGDPIHQGCYALNGVPIISQAVVRMTVPPVRANL